MPDLTALSLPVSVVLFIVGTVVIGVTGVRMVAIAETLAARTGIGQGVFGAVFVGGSTSLAGIVTSVTAALEGQPEIAASNAVGGIAGQTAFLAIADITYRKANLEHASASSTNLLLAPMLVVLLGIPLFAALGPDVTVYAVHPATLLMIGFYVFGIWLASRQHDEPMWIPFRTSETGREKDPDDTQDDIPIRRLWLRFVPLALIAGTAGWIIAQSAITISRATGLSETFVGGIFTALATSLPELVTTIAAVRSGALVMAVSGIVGGNAFDTLFLGAADIAFRDGSLYHAITAQQLLLIVITIIMTGVMAMGLVGRQRYGFANIGWESLSILLLYVFGFAVILSM
jgi:cation:H+ antiporter